MQLICFAHRKLHRVFFNPGDRNKNVTGYYPLFLRIIKRDNICISVVLKILLVYFKQILIRTKNKSKLIQPETLFNNSGLYPLFYLYFIPELIGYIFLKEL